jgi:hypothetical protein
MTPTTTAFAAGDVVVTRTLAAVEVVPVFEATRTAQPDRAIAITEHSNARMDARLARTRALG